MGARVCGGVRVKSGIMERPRIAVVGAGIVGLCTANVLLQSTYRPKVTLIGEKFSPNTTSDLSGAIVLPIVEGNIRSSDIRQQEWTRTTFKYLYDLFSSPLAGRLNITLLAAYEVFDDEREDPWWKDCVLGFRHVGTDELKMLHYPLDKGCWSFTTLLVHCRSFLPWQLEQFKCKGGMVVQRRIESLQEIDGDYDIIVNCTGLGSRELVNDQQLYPVRGQTITVRAPWVKHAFGYDTKYSTLYVLPRVDDVLLGGTADVGNWSEQVDPAVSNKIIEQCCRYFPGLSTAPVVKEEVGLRPGRRTVRLEVDDAITKYCTVIHNYGHGGQGVTFFRGCALEVVKLADDCLMKKGYFTRLQ